MEYVGNDDFRGYLAYLAQNGDGQAQFLISGGDSGLGFVNNEGVISNQNERGQWVGGVTAADTQNSIDSMNSYAAQKYKEWSAAQGGGSGGGYTQPAKVLDTAQLQSLDALIS